MTEISKEYYAKLSAQLDNLKPYTKGINISAITDKAQREKYIEACKMYIDNGNEHYQFTNDYSKIYCFTQKII